MIRKVTSLFKRLGEGIEEIILIGIIILNILDFTEQLGPDMDYVKKILSWTALGYLLYKASITKILFGNSNKKIDLMLIIAYFILSFKNMIAYAQSTISHLLKEPLTSWWNIFPIDKIPGKSTIINMQSIDQTINLASINSSFNIMPGFEPIANKLTLIGLEPNNVVLNISNNISSKAYLVDSQHQIHRWLNYFVMNQTSIINTTLLIGLSLLILISIYSAFKLKIKAPSVMHIIHEEGPPPRSPFKLAFRILTIFLVLNLFFVIIFNLTMEWLAIAIDAPLLIIALFFYLLVWIKHHKRFNTEGIIFKLGNLGEEFYTKFVNLLKNKKGLLLGISGMLVLHILTEVGIFMIPYSIGISDSLYLEQPEFENNHNPIYSYKDFTSNKEGLYANDIAKLDNKNDVLAVSYVYIMNHIAMFCMLLIPAIIWYLIFQRKKLQLKLLFIPIFFAALTCFIIAPTFKLETIDVKMIAGVDIQTQSFLDTSPMGSQGIAFISLSIGFFMFILALWKRKFVEYSAYILSIIYFAYYILLFFIDLSASYIEFILTTLHISNFTLALYLSILLVMNLILYVGGFLSYLYEFAKN